MSTPPPKNPDRKKPAAPAPESVKAQKVAPPVPQMTARAPAGQFDEVLVMIEAARQRAY